MHAYDCMHIFIMHAQNRMRLHYYFHKGWLIILLLVQAWKSMLGADSFVWAGWVHNLKLLSSGVWSEQLSTKNSQELILVPQIAVVGCLKL